MKPTATHVLFVATAIAVALGARDVASQGRGNGREFVSISLPGSVSFVVTNVGVTTMGVTASPRVQFSGADLKNNRGLRVSVKADADFVPPGGTPIPASRVTWTTSNAVNGIGSNGTLSKFSYTELFQGNEDATSGRVDIAWRLDPPGVPLRAGAHILTMRWRLESVKP